MGPHVPLGPPARYAAWTCSNSGAFLSPLGCGGEVIASALGLGCARPAGGSFLRQLPFIWLSPQRAGQPFLALQNSSLPPVHLGEEGFV